MKSILFIVTFILMGTGVFLYSGTNDEITKKENERVESIEAEFDLVNGNLYTTHYDLNVNDEPMINGGDSPYFSISSSDEIILIEIKKDFAKIKYQGEEGWIPTWYITESASKIKNENAFIRVINTSANVYLYPYETPKYDYKLEEGKVVKIIASYDDWYCIEYIRYDCPEYDLTWIKKDNTVEYNESLVKEGLVNNEIKMYYEDGSFTGDIISGYVFVLEEKGDFYRVFGTGGQEGYINKKDFIPIRSIDDFSCILIE